MLNLLDLDDTVLEQLTSIKDVDEHNFFTEHRLRKLAVMDKGDQIAEFIRLRQDLKRESRLVDSPLDEFHSRTKAFPNPRRIRNPPKTHTIVAAVGRSRK